MAIKVIDNGLTSDLMGSSFTNIPSETVFNLGNLIVTTNDSTRKIRTYDNTLSGFVTPITLDTINITESDSNLINKKLNSIILNQDKSDLLQYARYGSMFELFRVSLKSILYKYPASLYVNEIQGKTYTIVNYVYDSVNNTTRFDIPKVSITNNFGLIIKDGNNTVINDNELFNLNLSYEDYVVWNANNFDDNSYNVIGFTGTTDNSPYINIICNGNPFPTVSATSTIRFHIKPKPIFYNRFYENLKPVEKFLIEVRNDIGYKIKLKKIYTTETGKVTYFDNEIIWRTSDGYNPDIDGTNYTNLVNELSEIGNSYDKLKTDLIYRFLTPESLKEFDNTDDKKVEKLLRIYGRQFDDVKQYIDAIINVYTTTYNKKKNMSDSLVKNFAKSIGWDVFTIVDDEDLLASYFSLEDNSKNEESMLPSEIDIELWRRILINTNYFFKSKGTRASFKSMLLLLGIPEPFINISEYVYTVDEVINPDDFDLSLEDIKSASFPYNSEGYPVAVKENNRFFFQISGDTDGGQTYINNYRDFGFNLNRTVDNKKSWARETNPIFRKHYTTPDYYQESSDLIINTKEVDVALDTSRGVEYDVYSYNYVQNFPIYSTGVTQAYVYINIGMAYGVSANTFTIPDSNPLLGEIQLNFNGITLKKGLQSESTTSDYYINPLNNKQVILHNGVANTYTNNHKDVITLTYMADQLGEYVGNSIKYIVTPVIPIANGSMIELPEEPNGDIQLSVDGVTLTKGSSLFTGDFAISTSNRKQILITNNALKNYLDTGNNVVTISYFTGSTNNGNLYKETEVYRVDSLFTTKVFYNSLLLKTVYSLNYEAFDVKSIKVVVNGITLQNGTDFILNVSNKKQVYINGNIKVGDIINIFYVLTDNAVIKDKSLISEIPVSQMSFLEYIEMINNTLINTTNHKVITDNNGGFYPTIWKLYEDYYKRSFLTNQQKSNGYTFSNLLPFTNKFNTAFQRFLPQLLPATIIVKNGGFLIRNTVFTKQKFTYKRGLNFDQQLNWFGDDGSEFRTKINV